MANSGEALFQRDIIETIRAYGRRASMAGGYGLKGGVSELGLTLYRLTSARRSAWRDYRLPQRPLVPRSATTTGCSSQTASNATKL